MPINLPTDKNANAVQVLGLSSAAPVNITVAGVSANTVLPTGTVGGDVVRVACDTDCYFVFNSSAPTADSNDHLFIQGVELLQVPSGSTHIGAIRVSADGVMTISKMD